MYQPVVPPHVQPTTPHSRRAYLRGLGTAAAGALGLVGTGRGDRPPASRERVTCDHRTGFPPSGITEWSDPVSLGNGEAATFAAVTPSGRPKFLGVRYSDGALADLPTAEAVAASEDGVRVHGAWSMPIPLELPDAAPAPFGRFGFNWNPEGHPPPGTYDLPHFDVHFYFEDRATLDAIPRGVADYAVPDDRLPAGYERLPNPQGEVPVVADMGEHLIDPTAPEFTGGTFANTLIWGAFDFDGDGDGEVHFVEPMLTADYLGTLRGVDRRPIPQPDAYPRDGWYPTAYAVRSHGDGGRTVALEAFVERSTAY